MIIIIDVMIFVIRIMLTCMLCMLCKYCEIMAASKVYAIWGTLWNYGNIKKDLWNMHLEFVKYGSPTCEIWNDVAEGHLWSMNFRIVNCETMKSRAEVWTYETQKLIYVYVNLWGRGPTCEFMWPGAICELWTYEAKGQTCELVNPKGRRPMW